MYGEVTRISALKIHFLNLVPLHGNLALYHHPKPVSLRCKYGCSKIKNPSSVNRREKSLYEAYLFLCGSDSNAADVPSFEAPLFKAGELHKSKNCFCYAQVQFGNFLENEFMVPEIANESAIASQVV